MPRTITQGFQILKENLEITDLQSESVSSRQINVRDLLKKELTVLDSFLTGSYKRNTMIAPLGEADVDIMLVLHPEYYSPDGYASVLDRVKRVLQKTYTTSQVSRDGQAITIHFTDFYVDVVPCFHRTGGGFLIPDTVGKQWIQTDPSKHVELWAAMNARKENSFVPLVKMLKSWNKKHSKLLQSFHLECLAYKVFENVTITDYPSGARFFFDKARVLISQGVLDPAGYGGNVGKYLDSESKRQAVLDRFESGLLKALEAEKFALEFKIERAYEKWGIIFGNYFPAFG